MARAPIAHQWRACKKLHRVVGRGDVCQRCKLARIPSEQYPGKFSFYINGGVVRFSRTAPGCTLIKPLRVRPWPTP